MKINPNETIKKLMKKSGVYQYEVAEQIGINEITLIRWLRRPLDEEKTERILKAIDTLVQQNAPFN